MYAYERIDVMQNCCLWIGGVKVSDLDGIRDNFNITDVKAIISAADLLTG